MCVHVDMQVPATESEALMSPLMPLLEKNRCRSFFAYCAQWEADKPDTWRGFDPKRHSMEQVNPWTSANVFNRMYTTCMQLTLRE